MRQCSTNRTVRTKGSSFSHQAQSVMGLLSHCHHQHMLPSSTPWIDLQTLHASQTVPFYPICTTTRNYHTSTGTTITLHHSNILESSQGLTDLIPKTSSHPRKMCRHNACRTCDDPLPTISCHRILRSRRQNCTDIKLPLPPDRRPWCTSCHASDSRVLCKKPWYEQWRCGYGNCGKEYLVLCELLWHRRNVHSGRG